MNLKNRMYFVQHFLLIVGIIPLITGQQQPDAEALRLCGNIHRVDIHTVAHINARFVNYKCALQCFLNETWSPLDPLNEGFPCLQDQGICHDGQCYTNMAEALEECSKRHDMDFYRVNATGTALRNSGCSLECAIDGRRMSLNVRNQGLPCGLAGEFCMDGICFVGHDQSKTTTAHVTPTTTTNSPSQVPNRAFLENPRNLKSIQISTIRALIYKPHRNLFIQICLIPEGSRVSLDGCRLQTYQLGPTLSDTTQTPAWHYTGQPITIAPEYIHDRLLVSVSQNIPGQKPNELLGQDAYELAILLSGVRYNQTNSLGVADRVYYFKKNDDDDDDIGWAHVGIEIKYN